MFICSLPLGVFDKLIGPARLGTSLRVPSQDEEQIVNGQYDQSLLTRCSPQAQARLWSLWWLYEYDRPSMSTPES